MPPQKPSKDYQPWRETLARVLVPTYLSLIFGLPTLVLAGAWMELNSTWSKLALVFFAPIVFSALLVCVAGLLSRPHQRGIIPGRFPRNTGHPIYFHRRLYGLCWTSVYYFKPAYFICLALPSLKWLTFRLFGYRGSMDFTVYPDTWIRDLPLVDFGPGAYLSNRATIGTNISLKNGKTLVDGIKIEPGGLVGHMAMLAPGVRIGVDAEIGAGAAVNMKAVFERGSFIGPTANVDAGAVVGEDASVGSSCYLGKKVRVDPGAEVPNGMILGNRQHFVREEAKA